MNYCLLLDCNEVVGVFQVFCNFKVFLPFPGGQIPMPDAGNGNQPFYTFVIQNGEIKVMQIVSSGN